jgi:hypothetical protein
MVPQDPCEDAIAACASPSQAVRYLLLILLGEAGRLLRLCSPPAATLAMEHCFCVQHWPSTRGSKREDVSMLPMNIVFLHAADAARHW